MRILRHLAFLLPAALIAAGMGMAVSCSKNIPEEKPSEPVLTVVSNPGKSSASSSFVTVKATGTWTLRIAENPSWASLSKAEGSGNMSDIVLSWTENKDTASRSCTLELRTSSHTVSAVFRQNGTGAAPQPLSVPAWMELPAVNDPALSFYTHPMTIDGKEYRNYSYYWDKSNLVAHWVAYPLNSTLLKGSCGRSGQWGLDPLLPQSDQPVLYNAYRESSEYARGHQIPSADRQQYEYNVETFYGVNMTPQNHTFNSGTWGNLETYVRDRSRMTDTLYVVTGCVLSSQPSYAHDNLGREVAIPEGYFKALLAYSKNRTISGTQTTGGYTAIAFYYKNEPYSGSFKNASMTIDELELLTGFDFFVNLPSVVGPSVAQTVESTRNSWWN